MRIVEDSESRLVLRDRTSFVSATCGAAALIITVFALLHEEPKALGSSILFMVFAIGFFRSSDVTFDKAARSCILKRRDMWRVSRTIIPFETVTNVVVEPMLGNDRTAATLCRLAFSTSRGDIALSGSYEPDLDRFQIMRDEVAKAIFGTASPSAPDPPRDLVEAGRPIDAITLLRRREGLGLKAAKERAEMLRGKAEDDRP